MFQENSLALPVSTQDYNTENRSDPGFFSATPEMPRKVMNNRRNSSLGLGGREMEQYAGHNYDSRMSTGRLRNHSGGGAGFVYSRPLTQRPRDNLQMGGSMDLITEAQDMDVGAKGGYRSSAVRPR